MNRAFAVTAVLLTGCPPLVRPQLRYVHPGIAQLLRLAGDQLPLAEFAALLALDPSDTLRGGNLEVSLFASDLTLRELTPRALELCGAKDEAAAMAKLGPITSQASLEKAANLLGSFESQDTQRRLCLEAAQKTSRTVCSARPSRRSATKRAGSTATLTTRGGPSAAGFSTAAFGPPSRSGG